jgi:AraC-like DNA-binding protein
LHWTASLFYCCCEVGATRSKRTDDNFNFFLLTVNGQRSHIDWLLMTRLHFLPRIQSTPRSGRPVATNGLVDVATSSAVEMSTMSGQFLAGLYESWQRPDWFLADTAMAQTRHVNDRITVREYLTIIGNIYTSANDPTYFIDYAMAGVPFFKGGIDLGTQCAPNLFAALELIFLHARNRPAYHQHALIEDDEWVSLELVPTIDLGRGRTIIVETPLLVFSRMAARCLGHPPLEAVIELRHGRTPHAARFQIAAGCEVRYGSTRDAISFPIAASKRDGMTYDADLWRTAIFRCKEEVVQLASQNLLFEIRSRAATFLAEKGRPPRLRELAMQIGVSTRTLVRRLRSQNRTYHDLVEELLKDMSAQLLGQPALKISEVSERLGFADPSSFYRSFRRWHSVTPGEFRLRL